MSGVRYTTIAPPHFVGTMPLSTMLNWLVSGRKVNLNGYAGHIQAIEREDGSGHCWNVTVQTNGRKVTTFVRTID